MSLRDMQILKSEKYFLPPPLLNPGDAPDICMHKMIYHGEYEISR